MNETITCTYIGHSTTLLRMGETTILTDPHFGGRVLFSPRLQELPLKQQELPQPSAILISHTHRDHFHVSSYKFIDCNVPLIVPEGQWRKVGRNITNPVIELAPFAVHELTDGTEITALPVAHRSLIPIRPFTTNASAYLIRKPGKTGTVFFCGDSAYGPEFGQAGNLEAIDLALLPIGGYEPRWLMQSSHMTPAEAVQAFEDLKAQQMVPIHHGTFRLSLETPDAPAKWIAKIVEERPELGARIHLLKPGESYDVTRNS